MCLNVSDTYLTNKYLTTSESKLNQMPTGFALSRVQPQVTEKDFGWCVQHALASFS